MPHGRDLLNNFVTLVTPFTETQKEAHWNYQPLSGYIYENVFDDSFCNLLQKNISQIFEKSNRTTYMTHGTTFNIEGQTRNIVGHKQNAREQNVIYDLTFDKQWFYQTIDTIKDWSQTKIKNNLSPIFQKCTQKIENLTPIKDSVDDYVLYRLHLNYLKKATWLDLHLDGNPLFTKGLDQITSRMYSFTFYLFDHIEGLGGELWSYNGFVYKPKKNSAILINGNQSLHGVTANMHEKPRLAFTVRIAHKEDLFLPGHPSKYLYKVADL